MAFNLEQWATDHELEQDTMKALSDKGFKSSRSISKLSAELVRKEFKNLIMGQQLLLIDAVDDLKVAGAATMAATVAATVAATTQAGMTGDTTTTPANVTVGTGSATGPHTSSGTVGSGASTEEATAANISVTDLLNMLHVSGNSQVQPDQTAQTGKPLIFDPFTKGDHSSGTSYRDIRDYISLVPKHTPSDNAAEVFSVGSHEFCLKDKRPTLESISVAQYMEASLKILREMAIKEKLSVSDMLDYINYVIKIATFSQSFQWASVLKYDLEYRKTQAELNFRWGADNAYLMQVILKTRPPVQGNETKKSAGRPTSKVDDKFDPRSGKPICRNWNKNACTLHVCNYAHVCAICFHPSHTSLNHVASRPPRPQTTHVPDSQHYTATHPTSQHYTATHPTSQHYSATHPTNTQPSAAGGWH
jgi:hypothetical protein